MDEAFNSKAAELSWDWSNVDHKVQDPYSIIRDIVKVKTGENPQATDWQGFNDLSSLEEYNNLEFSNMEKPSWDELRSWYDEQQSKVTITDGEMFFAHGEIETLNNHVIYNIDAKDPDGDSLNYSISGDDAQFLSFDEVMVE